MRYLVHQDTDSSRGHRNETQFFLESTINGEPLESEHGVNPRYLVHLGTDIVSLKELEQGHYDDNKMFVLGADYLLVPSKQEREALAQSEQGLVAITAYLIDEPKIDLFKKLYPRE